MLSLNFKGKNLNIVKKYWIFVIVSAVIILAGLVDMLFIRHMNFGVEFSGGIGVEITAENTNIDVKAEAKKWFEGGNADKTGYVIDGVPGTSGTILKTTNFRLKSELKDGTNLDVTINGDNESLLVQHSTTIKEELTEYLKDVATKAGDNQAEIGVETHVIGGDVKNHTVTSAVIAVSVAVVVILAYIAIRFNLLAGVSAVIALLHDVLIMFSLTTLFQIPVNMTFIAAVITIIGYSINATIVVFDRVRELNVLPSYLEKTDAEIAEDSIMGTMSRSILTTLTTLVMIICLAIFGNASIREFAVPIIFGLIAGLYSSILLSASTWVRLRKLFKQENKKPTKKIKRVKEQAKA